MDDRVCAALLFLIAGLTASAQPLPEGAVARIATAPGEPAFIGFIRTALSPDGRTVAVADEAGRLDLWSISGKRLRTLRTSGPKGGTPHWSPDGRWLYSGHAQGLAIWDIANPGEPRILSGGFKATEGAIIAVSPDGSFVVATQPNSTILCWDVESGRERWRSHYDGPIGVTADSRYVVRSYFGKRHDFLSATTGNEACSFGPPLIACSPTDTYNFAISPDGQHMAVYADGRLTVCDAYKGREVWTRRVFRHPANPLVFSHDGHWLATNGDDHTLLIWDAATGDPLDERAFPGLLLQSIDFTPDGRRVLIALSDRTAILRELAPPEPKPADAWRALSSEGSWQALSSEGGTTIYAGIWSLAGDPSGPATLRAKLSPAPRLEEREFNRLISDLDSSRHAFRERASRVLSDHGRAAVPVLRSALERVKSAEAAARLEKLIQAVPRELTAPEITHRRAVKAMSLARTAEARELLAEWAAGAPGAVLTEEAKAALARLR